MQEKMMCLTVKTHEKMLQIFISSHSGELNAVHSNKI